MARRFRHSGPELALMWLAFYALPRAVIWLYRLVRPAPAKAAATRRRNPPGWSKARMQAFERNRAENGGELRCEQCLRTEADGVEAWHAHHLKSFRHWPEHRVDPENIAVWCKSCNLGSSDRYMSADLQPCERRPMGADWTWINRRTAA